MEILIILVLLVLNGLFAMCEIALVSSRRSRLEQSAAKGSNGAKTALKLLEEPEKFLSTVQVGITLVGIVAGAYGGEAFTADIKPFFEKWEWLRPYAQEIAFISVVAVITYFSLIIGELVPKTIAMNNPEGITIRFAPFMRLLSVITYPIVVFLTLSTKIFLKILMIKEKENPAVTEEELKYMIETGSQHGVIEQQESEIMKSVFRFGDHTASTIMTHRSDIVWLDSKESMEKTMEEIQRSPHSKFPVCDQNLDKILGYVTVKDLLHEVQRDKTIDFEKLLQEPVFIPVNAPALRILDTFRKRRIHIGFVVNEFGGVEGLITLHDLIENIVGEFPEQESEAVMVQREDGSWLADGELRIEELKNMFGAKFFPLRANYATLAGFVIHQLERIPVATDHFEYKGYRFEVLDMDGNRVDKVLIKSLEQSQAPGHKNL